jgi:hypothetical protein
MSKKLVTNLGLIVLAVAVVIGFQMITGVSTVKASADKDCVCHAAGKDGSHDTPQQYICLHPSVQGVTLNDNGGHLNEDSSHGPEHAPDFLCTDCSECGPAPSPEPSPSPSPEPSPSPSPA